MSAKIEAAKIAADTVTGVTLSEAGGIQVINDDSNTLLVTLITIISRVVIEAILNRRAKRAEKKRQKQEQAEK